MPHPGHQADEQDPEQSFASYRRDPSVRERFCKGCRYNLRCLTGGPCPECGLPFSMTNPRTYLTSDQLTVIPRGWWSGRIGRLILSLGVGWGLPGLIYVALRVLATWGTVNVDFLLTSMCCFSIFIWPLICGTSVYFALDAVMPEAWDGVLANVGVGLVLGFLVVLGQSLMFFGLSLIAAVIGMFTAPAVGLFRAYRQT